MKCEECGLKEIVPFQDGVCLYCGKMICYEC